MRGLTIALIWTTLSPFVMWAQSGQPPVTPQFGDYAVAEVFRGTPAMPIIATPEQRNYQTRIQNGVLGGLRCLEWQLEEPDQK